MTDVGTCRVWSNPVAFVGGCPRSGTTLLQRMLDSHPQLACANDTHFIPRVLEKHQPEALEWALAGRPIPLTDALVNGTLGYHRFRRLGVSIHDARIAANEATTYQAFISRLYCRVAECHGKRYAAEKTPDYVRRTPILAGMFPQSRCVHIWRDGRDVALSLLDWATPTKGPGRLELWKSLPLATAALWWQEFVVRGREEGPLSFGSRYLGLSYEALLQSPDDEVARVAAHLGLPFDPCMLEFHRGRTHIHPKRSAKQNWLPPTPGLRNWRHAMTQADVQLFEALAGDTLEQCGYPRSEDHCPPHIAERAERARAWWRQNRPFSTHAMAKDDRAQACPLSGSAG